LPVHWSPSYTITEKFGLPDDKWGCSRDRSRPFAGGFILPTEGAMAALQSLRYPDIIELEG
jgi:hypothetical protein